MNNWRAGGSIEGEPILIKASTAPIRTPDGPIQCLSNDYNSMLFFLHLFSFFFIHIVGFRLANTRSRTYRRRVATDIIVGEKIVEVMMQNRNWRREISVIFLQSKSIAYAFFCKFEDFFVSRRLSPIKEVYEKCGK